MAGGLTERTSGGLLLALAAAALVCVGCGSGSSASAGGSEATAATGAGDAPRVAMKVLEFTPGRISARVGQTLTWTNEDTSPHNVTYVSGPQFPNSPRHLNPGSSFSIKLTQPGTIHYFCTIHPWMKGTIVVSP